ncbi:MAG: hypothetical protein ABIL07_05190 [candidate division WOR-3 bacterium]
MFNPNNRLVEFTLFRPYAKEGIKEDAQNFDSLVVPGMGAFGFKFNVSLEQAKQRLGA